MANTAFNPADSKYINRSAAKEFFFNSKTILTLGLIVVALLLGFVCLNSRNLFLNRIFPSLDKFFDKVFFDGEWLDLFRYTVFDELFFGPEKFSVFKTYRSIPFSICVFLFFDLIISIHRLDKCKKAWSDFDLLSGVKHTKDFKKTWIITHKDVIATGYFLWKTTICFSFNCIIFLFYFFKQKSMEIIILLPINLIIFVFFFFCFKCIGDDYKKWMNWYEKDPVNLDVYEFNDKAVVVIKELFFKYLDFMAMFFLLLCQVPYDLFIIFLIIKFFPEVGSINKPKYIKKSLYY